MSIKTLSTLGTLISFHVSGIVVFFSILQNEILYIYFLVSNFVFLLLLFEECRSMSSLNECRSPC